ncbi:MAG: L-histidine N(alpha)-methyltransferase [Cyanomargarita calcarea GSE-NOS-MK-12-04C]|jgi:uncharacterized SAM-dependent methyltransferase|uniref:L-histidine N(Alpha)-methyltransferase n=1 Tax=Cyanomargarita calcarea GSE-NOS-MK-12-04C TaxID=2839659 RepID=A0A951USU0_9CYAN|nr:L-histidine N(alpha)-methyltransferase [Cyanomargarita calcarea GSE-NOS-MK-12-04C]
MAKKLNSNSEISTQEGRIAKPNSEFYSIFSTEEVLGIIHALEVRREIPLKYSYKGRGAKTWDDFYRKYIIPRWYRTSNVEIDLLRENFEYINRTPLSSEKVNIIDVGSGNSYPVKQFIFKLNQLGRINKYIALDISEELLDLSRNNFNKWFPLIKFQSYVIDIENSCFSEILTQGQNVETDNIAKIFFHLGVTIGNHHNRSGVLKNFRNNMVKNDLLVFTNEIGSNSQWDGKARGALDYHAEQIYVWIKNKIGIRNQDCELVRKYDEKTDSVVANIKFNCNLTINFSFMDIVKNIQISEGEEITIWRHHKHEITEIKQEIEQAGLEIVHYSTNKYLSHIMVICKVGSN